LFDEDPKLMGYALSITCEIHGGIVM